MKLGIFGGTFDPPHLGHLILAAEAYDQLCLDRLLWVLTPTPPHKLGQEITATETRIQLVQAAITDNPTFEFSRVDIDRPGPHYAVDTVRILAEQFPDAQLYYLIGGDSLRDLPKWHTPQALVEGVDVLGVMRRPGDAIDLISLEQNLPGITRKVRFVEAPLLEIAASQIRQRVREDRPYCYYVPGGVYQIIHEQNLYRN
jgi:nicotinate-nucleotide adenylyltransferase